jgi:hypothetical protein
MLFAGEDPRDHGRARRRYWIDWLIDWLIKP